MELSRKTLLKNKTQYDYEFVDYLLEMIINSNPMDNCNVGGELSDWNNLPKDKSLFYAKVTKYSKNMLLKRKIFKGDKI